MPHREEERLPRRVCTVRASQASGCTHHTKRAAQWGQGSVVWWPLVATMWRESERRSLVTTCKAAQMRSGSH
eukprot:scaffold96563_cov77-Phaeocystis_antarctica.AAC.1